jgi:energy-coupling factor transport system permease protein
MALNAIVPSHELVRMIPPAFQDLSVVILIAVTYIPETRRHLQRIREAQAVRGHRPKGLRDWRPLFVPLLVGGLERAMQLSEAMVARGHAHASASGRRTVITLALVAGIVISISGWIVSVLWGGAGYIIMSAGGLILIIAIIHEGRKVKRTRFHSSNWSIMDTAMAAAAFLALLLVFVIWPLFGTRELNYNPYPVLGLPDYHPVMVVAFTLLTFPIASALFMQADTDNPEAKQYQATKKRDGMGQTP